MKKVEKLVKILLIMVMMVAALLFTDLVVLALMVEIGRASCRERVFRAV